MKIKICDKSLAKVKIENNEELKNFFEELTVYVDGYEYNPKYISGQWDGKIKFYKKIKNNLYYIPYGISFYLKEKFNAKIINEIQINEFEKEKILNYINSLNLKYELRNYQKETIIKGLLEKFGVYGIATGGGKSLIQAIIMKYLIEVEKINVILIVPSISLVEQFNSDLISYFGKEFVDKNVHLIYTGKEKTLKYPITITTWQSIAKIKNEIEDKEAVIVDEVHKAKNFFSILASQILPIMKNTKYKLGFTGTIPYKKFEYLTLSANFGKIETILRTKDLIDLGYGTPIKISIIKIFHSRITGKLTWQKEMKFLEESEIRNKIIAKLSYKIYKNLGNLLVLVKSVNHGKKLIELLFKGISKTKNNVEFISKIPKKISDDVIYIFNTKKYLKNYKKISNLKNFVNLEDYNLCYIFGAISPEEREYLRKKANEKDYIIISNYQVFSTGINIKNLKNLIFASPIKDFITIIQALGRTIRKSENKNVVNIFDLVDIFQNRKTNYSKKHYLERLTIYKNEGHPISFRKEYYV